MGGCLITVHVTGAYHNGRATDIDQMAADFVAHLRAKGHEVTAATMGAGCVHDLNPASRKPIAPPAREDR